MKYRRNRKSIDQTRKNQRRPRTQKNASNSLNRFEYQVISIKIILNSTFEKSRVIIRDN